MWWKTKEKKLIDLSRTKNEFYPKNQTGFPLTIKIALDKSISLR